MQFIWWMIIIIGILFILLFILGFIILYRVSNKNKIRINILLKARQWTRFKVKLKTLDKQITYNDTAYIFDDRGIIKGKYCDNIYYYEGNPEPIIFDFQQNVPKTQSKDLQTILDSDLIDKLFGEKRLARMELLLFIILGISALILFGTIGQFLTTANIVNDLNREFIYNVTRSAILGQ